MLHAGAFTLVMSKVKMVKTRVLHILKESLNIIDADWSISIPTMLKYMIYYDKQQLIVYSMYYILPTIF